MNHLKAKFTLGFFLCLLRRSNKRICHGQTHDPNLRIIGIEFNSLKNSSTSNKGFFFKWKRRLLQGEIFKSKNICATLIGCRRKCFPLLSFFTKTGRIQRPLFLINGCAAIRMNCPTSGITFSFSFCNSSFLD